MNVQLLKRNIVKYLLAIIIILGTMLFLLRANFEVGMQFDEVFRVNNIIPFLNSKASSYNQSICNIDILGLKIPLMYKQYISSTFLLFYLPLRLFDDYLFGIRFIKLFYSCIVVILLFLIISWYHFYFAFLFTLLIITSPLIYQNPFPSSFSFHILFIPLSILFFHRYYHHIPNKLTNLFLAVFLLFFSVNYTFYSSWTVISLILVSIAFFPYFWKTFLTSYKRILVIVVGFFLAMFNYIVYNIKYSFPTLKPLYYKWLNPSEYHKVAIDYKQIEQPLFDEIISKIKIVFTWLGEYNYLYIILISIIIIYYLIALIEILKNKKFHDYKLYFFSLVVTFLIFSLILISPNTTRPPHYTFISPFFELSILSLLVLIYKLVKSSRLVRLIVFSLPILLLILNFYTSNKIVAKKLQTKGTGYFSPAIFDLNTYINKKGIKNNLAHLQWGFYSQLYFLNKGEINTSSLVFQSINLKDDKTRFNVFKFYFLSPSMQKVDTLYFPLYNSIQKDITDSFFNFINAYGGKLSVEKHFHETNGAIAFSLFKLDVRDFLKKAKNRILNNIVTSDELRIRNFGPKEKRFEGLKSFGMWFKTVNNSKNTKIMINEMICRTIVNKENMTALIPSDAITKPGNYNIQLIDIDNNIKSYPVYLSIIGENISVNSFVGIEKKDADIQSFIDFSKFNYNLVKGLYEREQGRFRWSKKHSAFLLKYNNEKYFSVKLFFPDLNGYSSKEIKLSVKIDNQTLETFDIDKSGSLEKYIMVPAGIEHNKIVIVSLNITNQYISPSDKRELGFIVSQIGFKDL
ncbi:MAG: hypothetical protein ACMUJM_10220 [bacterium]